MTDLADIPPRLDTPSQELTGFHFYELLPPEMKIMVWEHVFREWFPGAHRLRLRVNPKDSRHLVVQPDKGQTEDASAWRERRAIASVDKYAFNSLRRVERRGVLVYKEQHERRRIKAEEIGARAVVYGEADIVTFRFNYGTSLAQLNCLSIRANRETFAGITQIGIELSYLATGYLSYKKNKPFRCPCALGTHHAREICDIGIVRFLRFFKDLKVIYLIYPLTNANMNPKWSDHLIQHVTDTHSFMPCVKISRIKDHIGTQERGIWVSQCLDFLAKLHGLAQFHDRQGTYHELPREYWESLGEQFDIPAFWYLETLKQTWTKYHTDRRTAPDIWREVQFKVAAYADYRGITLGNETQPVRRLQNEWS